MVDLIDGAAVWTRPTVSKLTAAVAGFNRPMVLPETLWVRSDGNGAATHWRPEENRAEGTRQGL